MIQEQAQVSSVNGEYAWIQKARVSSCSGCQSEDHCGTSAISKVVGKRYVQVKALNTANAQVGDSVLVELPESTLLSLSFLAYLMPLVLLMLGAILASFGYPSVDLAGVFGGLFGFLIGVALLKWILFMQKDKQQLLPIITKVTASPRLDAVSVYTP